MRGQRRVALAALSFLAAATVLTQLTASPHRWFVALLAPAVVLGITRRYLTAFVPFGLLGGMRSDAERDLHRRFVRLQAAGDAGKLNVISGGPISGWATHRLAAKTELCGICIIMADLGRQLIVRAYLC